ncbi:RHS repeat domain-containing protein [Flavobacterium eburneipallidum]|uniref:RHS repeat domain-containing protein n=1 Tax=Flavobacterium eburneipallidum TaxID=3003263 RepID=UPI0024829B7F|nr:RHS repeat domain-containing protein [Flavobacterium eburneipallidum]
MKIKLLLAVGILSWSMFSQQSPDTQLQNFAPRTPEATAFLKYGEYPVNLSSGVPNISIPLYTVNIGGFTMPISLDYHASGIKVSQEATMVGLGWNLNVGAQIILSSRDEIDENNSEIDNLNINVFNNYFNNHPYAFNSPLLFDYQKSKVKDLYVFSSPTVNGNFYINNFNNNDVVVFPPDAFKVELLGANRANLSFKITDKLGNIYMFNNTIEKSHRWLTHHDYYIGAWYVDQITTPKNGKIYFTYQDDGEIVENSISEYREITDEGKKCGCSNSTFQNNLISPIKQSLEKTYTNTKKLKEISFNDNQSKIEFILKSGREDLINQNSLLESIKIQNKADGVESQTYNLINQIFFEYSYFNSTSTGPNSYKSKRLKLERIFDLDETNIHRFVYSQINLPAKDSKSQDYFGYYNGATNSDMIPKHFINNTTIGNANRTVNDNATQAGILKEIHYPTKGLTKFNYENNTFFGVDELDKYSVKNESCVAIGSGPANSPAEPWEEGMACPNPTCIVYSSVSFNANNANGALSYNIRNNGSTSSAAIKYKFCRVTVYSNGNLVHDSGKKNVNFDGQLNIGLNGNCIIQLEAYGSGMHISASMSYVDNDTSLKNVKGPGLRIQSIENYTSNNTTPDLKKTYDYSDKDDSARTSGKTINPLAFSFVSNRFSNFTTGICPSDDHAIIPFVDFTKTYNVSSQSKNSSESNSVTYKFVKEIIVNTTNPTENVFSSYEFTTDEDWILPNFNIQINQNWKRGKVIEKNDYKSIGAQSFIVRKEKNNYFEDNSKISYYSGFKFVKNSTIDVNENIGNPLQAPNSISTLGSCGVPQNVYESYLLYNYNYPMPWFYQKSSETTDYFYNSNNVLTSSLVNKTDFFYDNPNHLQLTREQRTNSNNEIITTKYHYPDDLLNIPLMTTLKDQNRIGEVIKTESFRNITPLSAKNTIYKNWGNNLIAPEIIQTAKGSGNLENRIIYNVLDNTNGNPNELQMIDGTVIVYIWGYNKTQPVAKIENTSYSSINPSLINAVETASVTGTETNLLDALTNLRSSLPNAMVTTYTYKPLIGVSTITDSKGDTVTYNYDAFGRLQNVKDKDGNILSENEYHYKN